MARRIAYADPPYPGMAHFYVDHPDYGGEVDHGELMAWMDAGFDSWALSTASTTLREVLAVAPDGVRVAAWVKPFASFKPGVNPAYTWEPVLFKTKNRPEWSGGTTRDHAVADCIQCNITLKKGLVGAKPKDFCFWVFDLLGATPEDEFVDLFPGTGGVTKAWREWSRRKATGVVVTGPLFGDE
jgi:hypothetical protein